MGTYVRHGNLGDIPWMLEQFKDFSEYMGNKKSLYDRDYAEKGIENFLNNGLVIIAESEAYGQIGFIVGAITPHLFNPEVKVLAELAWWVDPACRRKRASYLLFKKFVDWGKKNADWITFAMQVDTKIKDSTLEKFGFKQVEKSYLIEVGC